MYYGLRFMQISGLVAIIVLILIQLNQLHTRSNDVRNQQTEMFSSSLTNLAAAEASRYFLQEKEKEQALQLLINDLSKDPMVRDATIYDHLGKVLYQSEAPIALADLLRFDQKSASDVQGIIPYIAELYNEDEKIGYLRISLQQDHILGIIFNYQAQSLEVLILLLSLSFLAGGIILALFFRRVEAWYYRLTDLIPNLIASNKKL